MTSLNRTVASESDSNAGTQDQLAALAERLDDLTEKLYDFEVNKRNNLIFYGIPTEPRETPSMLLAKVHKSVLTVQYKVVKKLNFYAR